MAQHNLCRPADAAQEWRSIPFAPDYEISEHGLVRRKTAGINTSRFRVRKVSVTAGGYFIVGIRTNDCHRKRNFTINRLVAIVFLGEPPTAHHQAAHKDGNKANNHFMNLVWATRTENEGHKKRHGTYFSGGRGPRKLTCRQAVEIRALEGVRPCKEVAGRYGISESVVRKIWSRDIWSDEAILSRQSG